MKSAKQYEAGKGVKKSDGNNQHDKNSLTQPKHNDWKRTMTVAEQHYW